MNAHRGDKSAKSFWFFIALAFALGVFLRLYMIAGQILLDDEWHGLNYTIGRSFSYLLTHFGAGATCISMNLYRLFLLKTFGWTELLLKLPPLVAGILSLVVLPVFVRKIFSSRVTIIFAFLFAINPFLIFYSRVSRPYSFVVLFGVVCLLSLYLWVDGAGRRYVVIYVITGTLTVYFHFFAAIAVFLPLGYVFVVKLVHNLRGSAGGRNRIVPRLGVLFLAGAGIGILLSLLFVPALIQSPLPAKLDVSRVTAVTIAGFISMLSGTANELLIILFLGLSGYGLMRLLREKTLLGGIFISVIVFYFAAVVIPGSDSINSPIVLGRYIIVVFPLGLVLAALGADSALKYLQSSELLKGRSYGAVLTNFIGAALLVCLFLAGPLVRIYAKTNNFIGHSAFQAFYAPLGWEQSYVSDIVPAGFTMKKSSLSSFYHQLSSQPATAVIIEYPMALGNHFNLYYYYQQFHKKRIIAGYYTGKEVQDSELRDYVMATTAMDQVLFRVADASKLKFKNAIDMMDIDAIKNSGADYVILHENLLAEMFPHLFDEEVEVYKPVTYLNSFYRGLFGKPVFEEGGLIAFKISRD